MKLRSMTALLLALLVMVSTFSPLACAASCGTAMRAVTAMSGMSAEAMEPCPMEARGLPGRTFAHRGCCAHAACAGLLQASPNAVPSVQKRVQVLVLPVAIAGLSTLAYREGRSGNWLPRLWPHPPRRSSRSSLTDKTLLRV